MDICQYAIVLLVLALFSPQHIIPTITLLLFFFATFVSPSSLFRVLLVLVFSFSCAVLLYLLYILRHAGHFGFAVLILHSSLLTLLSSSILISHTVDIVCLYMQQHLHEPCYCCHGKEPVSSVLDNISCCVDSGRMAMTGVDLLLCSVWWRVLNGVLSATTRTYYTDKCASRCC